MSSPRGLFSLERGRMTFFIALVAVVSVASGGWAAEASEEASSGAVKPGDLYVGWASVSILPGDPIALCGQYSTRISAEVHDPLQATALALETRGPDGSLDQAMIVTCDLVVVRRVLQERLRQRLSELGLDSVSGLDPRKVVLTATHTHTAPALTDAAEHDHHPYDFMGMWAYRVPAKGVLRPARYLDLLVDRLADVVVRAWSCRTAAQVSWARGHAVVGHNRRAVYADGTARMYGRTTDPNFRHIEGSENHTLDTLFFWSPEGKLTGLAIAVPCPAQEVEGKSFMSADFWHEVRQLLRQRYGADLEVLPLNASSGDQSPHLLLGKRARSVGLERDGIPYTREIARRIARGVEAVIAGARERQQARVPLAHAVADVPLAVRQVTPERFEAAKAIFESGRNQLDSLSGRDYIGWRVARALMARFELQKKDPSYQAEIHVLRLGEVAVATNPFELYVAYGMQIEGRSPAEQTISLQLTADGAGYLPTPRAVQGGGYSSRIEDGVVGPEGGQQLVEHTVAELDRLWGK